MQERFDDLTHTLSWPSFAPNYFVCVCGGGPNLHFQAQHISLPGGCGIVVVNGLYVLSTIAVAKDQLVSKSTM